MASYPGRSINLACDVARVVRAREDVDYGLLEGLGRPLEQTRFAERLSLLYRHCRLSKRRPDWTRCYAIDANTCLMQSFEKLLVRLTSAAFVEAWGAS
jgi:hypothetical protein